ncbi:hypothetical protein BRYFOR_08284 [Marvinbryantia formatexigens DSM 14469]|uniref:CARDB domain-containing protein n=1 Tax=Marvinbryantia formatexigens DSM 14469 TaxID=478749 RepID=C6LI13_9FIRM|nr:hypothetical protein [Marvinbryantia formatexigens]EET59668.1 hypothetical protein BRYFOR_08284 [Marvinbryantia formatexigens DSM 14469]UWO26671.1 hypothetical protein NQ534_09520 [Marvinbryantia formatexigens DSM 14469]SDG44848.1 hypothetical protein SAMN05660368_02584 [Marvinbryantia formatexigens]
MKKKTVIILLIVAVLLTAGVTFAATGMWQRQTDSTSAGVSTEEAESSTSLGIDPGVGAEIETESEAEERGVAIPGWGSITLPAGETEANVSLTNPEDNADMYYLTFELRLKETDEVIFSTTLVPPGESCNKVTLNRELEAGEYEAVLHVQPYRMADETPTNNADMETTLIVK